MAVWHHLAETIDVLPYILVLRVKDMWSVCMHHYASFMASSVAIAGDMITTVKNSRTVARIGKFTGNYSTRKTCSNYGKSH